MHTRRLGTLLTALGAASLIALATAAPASAATPGIYRTAGADRYETSVVLADQDLGAAPNLVYLASGANFPDALSATAPAALEGASLMLTAPDSLPPSTAAFLAALAPANIVIVGGVGAVSTNVETQLRAIIPGVTITRVGGADRYETNRNLIDRIWGSTTPFESALVATGTDFPDALSAGYVAGGFGVPLILVPGQSATGGAALEGWLNQHGNPGLAIAGGPGAVSTQLEQWLSARATGFTLRFAGADRYATNAALMALASAEPFTASTDYVTVATGTNWPDALSAAPYSVRWEQGFFMTPPTCIAQGLHTFVQSRGIATLELVGGPGVLGPGVESYTLCPGVS